MLISDISVKRPVFATVVSVLIVAFGVLAFRDLPLREYPDIDAPVVSVETVYRGAAANVVESRITQVIEERIAGVEGNTEWRDTVIEILDLEDRLTHRPAEMSGGQQQRVAAARALASRPQIVFADEPSGNLDTKSAQELLGFLRRAVDEFGQTIVMVTHDPAVAAYADRVVFLRDGVPVAELASPDAGAVLDQIKRLEA